MNSILGRIDASGGGSNVLASNSNSDPSVKEQLSKIATDLNPANIIDSIFAKAKSAGISVIIVLIALLALGFGVIRLAQTGLPHIKKGFS